MLANIPNINNYLVLNVRVFEQIIREEHSKKRQKRRRKIYLFPIVAGTNYHKLSGLKQYKFIILQFRRSEVQNQFHWAKPKVSAGLCSFWKLWGRTFFPAFYQLQEAACTPQLMVPSLQPPLLSSPPFV